MKIKNLKLYSLSNSQYVVSYFDPVRKTRIQKNFTEELKAKIYLTSVKATENASNKQAHLKIASAESAVRVYLEQCPDSCFAKAGKLIRTFLDFFSVHGVQRLTETNLRSFFIHLKNEYDYSDRSLLKVKSALQGFFNFLIEQEAIEVSPLDGIKLNRLPPYKRKPILLSEEDINRFIEKAKHLSPALFHPIFLLINETAAKTSDILSIQWKDIQFKTSVVSLTRSKELQDRSFTVSDELIRVIQRIDRMSDRVFTSLNGQPVPKHILGKELKRFQRSAGLSTKWGLKDLRASYGLIFLKRGGSVKDLQKIMGHVRPYQTEEIYGRYKNLISNLNGPEAV